MVCLKDIGFAAAKIFTDPTLIGKNLGIASDQLTGAEIAQIFSNHLQKKVIYNALDNESYRKLGFPGSDDLGNMF